MKKLIWLLSIIIFQTYSLEAQGVFTSNVTTGNWSTAGSWTLSSGTDTDGIPDADDNVTISNGHTITLTANASCSTLTTNGTGRIVVGNSATARTLSITSTAENALTNNGTIDLSTSSAAHTLQIASSNISTYGTLTSSSASIVEFNRAGAQTIGNTWTYTNLSISGGSNSVKTLAGNTTVSGTLTISASTTLDFGVGPSTLTLSGTGTTNLANSGTIDLASNSSNVANTIRTSSSISLGTVGTITMESGNIFEYFSGAQTIDATLNYQNLTLSGSSVIKTLGANLTVAGTLTIASTVTLQVGTSATARTLTLSNTSANSLVNNGTINLSTSSAAHTLRIAASSISTYGNLTTSAASVVEFNRSGVQTIGNTWTYTNLTVSGGSSSVKTLAGNTTVSGTLTVASSTTLDFGNGPTILTLSGTGTTNLANSGIIDLATNSSNVSNTIRTSSSTSLGTVGTITMESGNTIEYLNGAQTIDATINYQNLTLSGSSVIKTLSGNTNVAGTLTIASTVTLNFGTVGFTLTLSGTGTNNLSNNGIINLNDGINVGNTIKTASSTSIGTRGTINMESGNIFEYYASGNQTIEPISYQSLVLSGSGVKTMTSVTTVSGNFTMSGTATTSGCVLTTVGGNLHLSGTTNTLTTGANLNITGTTTIASGCTLTLDNFTFTANGATSITGTLNTMNSAHNTTKTFSGAVTINSNGIWNLSTGNPPVSLAGNLQHNGATFNSGSGRYTFTSSAAISGSSTLTIIDLYANNGVVITNNSTVGLTVSSSLSGTGTGSLTQGSNAIIKISNAITIPTITATASGNTVEYNSASSQSILTGTYNNLTISGGGNKSLSGNVTIGSTGIVTLNGGYIVPGANTFTIDNTSTNAISGGSSSSFVSGALRWMINTTIGSFIFPVGASSNYYPFTLTNPTRNASSQYITVSASASNSNGTNGSCVSSVSSSEYWTVTLSSANLSGASISLGRNSSLGTLTGIGQASTLGGNYSNLSGTISGNNINSSNIISTIASSGTSYFTFVQVTSTAPSIANPTSSSISSLSATLGGNITAIGCANVTERGIFYSTTNGFADGTGTKVSTTSSSFSTGTFTLSVSNLIPNTIYYYKAFATSNLGTVYTTQGSFTTATQTFPISESFESDAAGSITAGTSSSSGSLFETSSWSINNSGGGCGTNSLRLSNNISNQWYFTPRFYATAGRVYTVSYNGNNTQSPASINIYIATAQSSSSANLSTDYFTGSGSINFSVGTTNETSNGWLCTSSGTYTFGFKVSSGSSSLRLDCISISETTPATITWTGNTSSSWSTSTNWDLNRIPISTDIIIIPTGRPNYPSSVTAGNYNSLTLTHGGSGTINIGASIFSGNVTLNSSNAGNTIIIAGATSIGGNLSVGSSGSNFNFTVNGATTVNGSFSLGNTNTAVTSNLNSPITSTGAFSMGNNSNHVTNIGYTSSNTDAITASNTGNFTFYGTVSYNANSGNQRVMAPTYHGPIVASNGGSRFMNGHLDINNSLTISGGNWFSGSSTEQSTSGALGTDANVMLSNSPYKGSGRSGRWQGLFLASDLGGVGANDLITSLSFYINTKFSDRAFNNFTIKAALVNYGSFTQSGLNWPFKSEVMTTVFTPKDVTTTGSAWNTHIFDTPLVWDGTSNILIEITFNNLAAAGGSGLAPDGTSDDQVAYIAGAWADNIIVQTSSNSTDVTNATNGSNSNYKNYSVFNIANGPYNINITNNWTNSNGNFYHLQNTVTFDGSSNQNVTTNGDNYYNFTVQNTSTSSALTLLDDCNIENTATLTDGVIVTGNNKLICLSTTASKLTGYSNISFIQGNLRRYIATNTSTYGFPLGKGTNSTSYFLSEIINNNLTGITYLDGKFVGGTPADYTQPAFAALGKQMSGAGVSTRNLNTLDSQGYTQLDPNTQPSGGTYSIRLYNTNYTLGDWVDDGQCIMKRPSSSNNLNDFNMAGNINPDGGLGRKVSDGYLLSTGLTTFSEFIPGLEDATPLPIELYDFNVKYVGDKVKINWTTLSEINNDYFTIEKSRDGIHFYELTKIKGKGNTTHTSHYHTFDYYPQNGINYYRLKQTDFDGKYSHSSIESINIIHKSFHEPTIYPNPTSENQVNIKFSTDDDIPVKIKIFSNDGKVIINNNKETNKGVNVIHIDLDPNLTKGIYILELTNEFDILREKIHIN